MLLRPLGNTGIRVSAVAFGGGPISQLMTGEDAALQRATVRRAVEGGINWFDTAATYGDGRSERSLGEALRAADALDRVHLATKVRLQGDDLSDIAAAIHHSVAASLDRLGARQVTLLQLHNSITHARGDQPTSITAEDVLGPRGVLETFRRLRDEGLVGHFGLTGLGDREPLDAVMATGEFAAIQVDYSLLNPSAGHDMPPDFREANYDRLLDRAARDRVEPLAIRVFAGGALAGQEPAPHTYKTKFFPLDLYRRDQVRAQALAAELPVGLSLPEAALRFVLFDTRVATAILGLGSPQQVDEALHWTAAGPLPDDLRDRLRRTRSEERGVRSD